ncbi:MAG: hypothetical protein HKN33_05880 [Pyrinomonadaceae bacterium]|nr:hypothetical protein [Pyrinomonadaceae bacterium]
MNKAMKRLVFCFLLAALMLAASESANAQNCKPNSDQVAVFTGSLYQGSCTVLDAGDHPDLFRGILKDMVRSIIVGRNVKVRVCDKPGLNGVCETLEKSGDLRLENPNGTVAGSGVSLRVMRLPNASPPVNSSRNAGVVIFDRKTGYILGGYRNGTIVNDKTASTFFRTGDDFSFYGLEQGTNPTRGMAKNMLFAERCEVYVVDFKKGNGSLALSSNMTWNPTPRTPRILDPKNRTYARITGEFLMSKGITNPVVKNKQIIRVDLEGDGVDEVILSGRHVRAEDADVGQTFKKGSYSFLLVRKLIAGKVESIAIGTEIYTEDINLQQWAPRKREVTAIMDLDSDGIMEVVVHTTGYEGYGTTAYKIKDGKAVDVLDVGCGA